MIYRTKIRKLEGFKKKFIGGRSVGGAATKAEAYYLSMLNNEALWLEQEALRIADDLAEIEERERNLYYFIREREGLL